MCFIKFFHKGEEYRHPYHIDYPSAPKRRYIVVMTRNDTTNQNTQTNSYVPRNKKGRISSASLIMLRKVDEHRLIGRKHMSVA